MKKYENINLSTALTATLSDLDLAIEYAKASGDETLGKFLSYSVMDLWLDTHSCDDKDQRTVLYLEQGVDDFYGIAEDLSESFYEPFDKLEYNYPQSKAKRAQRHHGKYKDTKKHGYSKNQHRESIRNAGFKKRNLEKLTVKEAKKAVQIESYDYEVKVLMDKLGEAWRELSVREWNKIHDLFSELQENYLMWGDEMTDPAITLWREKQEFLFSRMGQYTELVWANIDWSVCPWMGIPEQKTLILSEVIEPLENHVCTIIDNLMHEWRYSLRAVAKARLG